MDAQKEKAEEQQEALIKVRPRQAHAVCSSVGLGLVRGVHVLTARCPWAEGCSAATVPILACTDASMDTLLPISQAQQSDKSETKGDTTVADTKELESKIAAAGGGTTTAAATDGAANAADSAAASTTSSTAGGAPPRNFKGVFPDANTWPITPVKEKMPGNTIHTLFTSNGSPYQNIQARIMVGTYNLVRKMPGGERLVALTRIMHRTKPDEVMDEVRRAGTRMSPHAVG